MSLEFFLKDVDTIEALREGPLGKYLDSFAQQLHDQRYNYAVAGLQIRTVGGFGRWIKLNRISVGEISSKHAEKYLRYRWRKLKRTGCDVAALRNFIDFLRRKRVIAEEMVAVSVTSAGRLVEEYAIYLRKERALAASTVEYYLEFVQKFLADVFGDGATDFSKLCATNVFCFVQRHAGRCGKRAKHMVTALRSFFRYLRYKGYITIDLAASVPAVASWRMATIPTSISPDQIELVLSGTKGREELRDYAMFLLLARLGLRAGEVVSLTLDDIDWQHGCLTVHGKGGHQTAMPLPVDVGEAIASYLFHSRPPSELRSVFLRLRAPIAALDPATVSTQVQRSLELAGIDSPKKGAHQFRHSLATELLRRGSSLDEIAELLRHRSTQTTEIYAKVDINALRKLALCWPGGAQ
jgi:site-specific recombinase XerD